MKEYYMEKNKSEGNSRSEIDKTRFREFLNDISPLALICYDIACLDSSSDREVSKKNDKI